MMTQGKFEVYVIYVVDNDKHFVNISIQDNDDVYVVSDSPGCYYLESTLEAYSEHLNKAKNDLPLNQIEWRKVVVEIDETDSHLLRMILKIYRTD